MTGGLIDLITKGAQDSVLIKNPEITFFLKKYLNVIHFFHYVKIIDLLKMVILVMNIQK